MTEIAAFPFYWTGILLCKRTCYTTPKCFYRLYSAAFLPFTMLLPFVIGL